MALINTYKDRQSSSLRSRIAAACWDASEAIRNESTATPYHDGRLAWADLVIQDSTGRGEDIQKMMSLVIVSEAVKTDSESITDVALQNEVNGRIDFFAAPLSAP